MRDVKKVNNSKLKNNKVGIVEKLAIDTKKKKHIRSIITSVVCDLGIGMRDVHIVHKIDLCEFVKVRFQDVLKQKIVSVLEKRETLRVVWGQKLLQPFVNTIQNRLVSLALTQDKKLIESMQSKIKQTH